MTEKNPLHIVYVDQSTSPQRNSSRKNARRQEMQAAMERLWHQNPQQFNPERDCMQRQRIHITFDALNSTLSLKDKNIADLGCGNGTLTTLIRDAGAHVDAVDVAGNALALLKEKDIHHINPIQDCLPVTSLKDGRYDAVVCTEVISYLKQDEYRLLMAELARLVKGEGSVICSTSLDINTEDPLGRFAALAETEFNIDRWIVGYHRLLIRLCDFFEIPSNYFKAYQNKEKREKDLKARKGMSRWWFACNSSMPLSYIWRMIALIFTPLTRIFRQNETLMKLLERACRFLWSDAGISHAIFIGKRRPLNFPVSPDAAPRELKHKRQVWE